MSQINVEIPSLKERNVYLCGDIDQTMFLNVLKEINAIKDKDKELMNDNNIQLSKIGCTFNENLLPPITLNIDSYGGEAYGGLGLYDLVRNNNLNVYVHGCAASAAILPLIAGKHRVCSKHSSFMIHSVVGFPWGPTKKIEEDLVEIKRLHNLYFNLITKHTKITIEKLNNIYETKKDWWLSADEALNLGLVDEII